MNAYDYPLPILEKMDIWTSHLKAISQTGKNKKLRIAGVVSERLYKGLNLECDFRILTEENWQRVLLGAQLDLILIESVSRSFTNEWENHQFNSEKESLLVCLIKNAKNLGIPTIFWNTAGIEFQPIYSDFSNYFKYIFIADKNQYEYESKDKKVYYLPPAIQPKIHNNFIQDRDLYKNKCIDILFDGIIDILKYDTVKDECISFQKDKTSSFGIIESEGIVYQTKYEEIADFSDSILGCVSYLNKLDAYKLSRILYVATESIRPEINQAWNILEAVASRCLVVMKEKSESIFFHELITDDKELIEKSVSDRLFFESEVADRWRNVYSNHTYNNRLEEICNILNLEKNIIKKEKISIITPTNRPLNIPRILKNFSNQTYENKELIIVFSGEENEYKKLQEKLCNDDVTLFLRMPANKYTGGAVNLGVAMCSGKYFFKMDDDDFYGKHYIEDIMLHLNSYDADFFGKTPSKYIVADNDECLYSTERDWSFNVVSPDRFLRHHIWFGGNTIGGRCDSFNKNKFPDNVYAAADTVFNQNIGNEKNRLMFSDDLGVIVERRNKNDHTWNMNLEVLKSQRMKTNIKIEQFLNI